ncbi:hypothetical protein Y032_0276g1081 [Ancylostoma ceylanicum]|uniref:Uncharacterized protein n=1 Tax=Ancylostoma ceylanicum TaxID=53326 RepID=A0A016S8D6_9BILA|nr:hypothetical protein Y032_0276g1081 [Ancylostoma ceylanicum]
MAAQNGLHALVADGVHSFEPRQLQRKGQLYMVHGVGRNGVEVPLLYAIFSKKKHNRYTTSFFDTSGMSSLQYPLITELSWTMREHPYKQLRGQQSGSESSPMDVVAMEQQAAQDRIEDDVNDLVARIANTMGPVPARQEQLADAQQSQALPARTSRRERWQTQAPEVNLQRTVASILSAVFQRVDDR